MSLWLYAGNRLTDHEERKRPIYVVNTRRSTSLAQIYDGIRRSLLFISSTGIFRTDRAAQGRRADPELDGEFASGDAGGGGNARGNAGGAAHGTGFVAVR